MNAQHIVVMGVSGCGKTTTGQALAASLGWPFVEGDSFHTPESIRKMAAGIPLNDSDRAPWLQALTERISVSQARGESLVMGCSALKRAYRDVLRRGAPRVRFLHIHGPRGLLKERLNHRPGHFFPARLLTSQLEALEPLQPDEDGMVVDLALPVTEQVRTAIRILGLAEPN